MLSPVSMSGKTSYFLALCVDISKTVGDTTKITSFTTDDQYEVAYAMTLDDLELL